MILCLDVGNTHIYSGVYEGEKLLFRFRYATNQSSTSDQFGVFFRNVLRENDIEPSSIRKISICSVVPSLDYTLTSACLKYFSITPFILQPGAKTGLKVLYRNPIEVGSDLIANSIGAITRYPKQNVIVVDFGTATTVSAITENSEYLGGVILPGIRLSMEALHSNTAKLIPVQIIAPESTLGRSTIESIQSGLYISQFASIKEIIHRMTQENFYGEKPIVLATGGFANLFEKENIFDQNIPTLILEGLIHAHYLNCA